MPAQRVAAQPNARAVARESARELVKNIAKQHGHLGEDILSQMTPEVRREVEEALLRKDEMIGSSVITLAKNLYNSSARFVFELLQNADDNSYTQAKSAGVAPFVSFRVYPRRIVLECNEDGFTQENLVAICNVGQSSKAGAQGYIGEKGIGFKSVFMVAWKVHIQSGDFSFYFQHTRQGSGMGMISPMWEETDEILDRPLTRITLHLHETGSQQSLAKQREITLQQFHELQATFLLFMKNLRKIDVSIYEDEDGNEPVYSTTFTMKQQSQDRVELKKRLVTRGETKDHTEFYHIVKEIVTDLPKNENRRYTDAELADEAYAKAEVVLAFPLTQDSVPIIKPQEIFAFLPVKRVGFPFLIQSDFVTDASRQDLIRSSERNASLLAGVARVFVHAVSQFCNLPELRFQWMRYLPNDKDHAWDAFWTKFLDDIRLNLKTMPTLWTKSHSKLRCIQDMRQVPATMADKNGQPLLSDLDVEQYLATEYSQDDLNMLTSHGLREMSKKEFLTRVRNDLNQDEQSIMFNPDTGDDWHSRVAKILADCWPQCSAQMQELTLIPQMNGEWVSAKTVEDDFVCFSQVKGYSIPTVLAVNLVDPAAEKNLHRRKLFSLLGVQEANVPYIRRLIREYHGNKINPGLKNSKTSVAFLYLTAHLDQENDNVTAYKNIKLVDHQSRNLAASSNTFYFPTDDPYGPQKLFQPLDTDGEEESATSSTLDVSILHAEYMSDCPEQPQGENLTWKTWLSQKLNVRDVIDLCTEQDLTKECIFVAKHYPKKFVSFLLKYWKFSSSKLLKNQSLIDKLLHTEVLCENGDMYPLGKTYVRSAQLEYINEFLREPEFFPWLKQDASLKSDHEFSDLNVIANELKFGYPNSELEFYLTTLQFIVDSNPDPEQVSDVDRIFELYNRIEARYHESRDSSTCLKLIRNAFDNDEKPLIYTAAYADSPASWTWASACVWEGPSQMVKKYPLKSIYKTLRDTKYTAEFFQTTLEISDAFLDDFIDELHFIRFEAEDVNVDLVHELYSRIAKGPNMDTENIKSVRSFFNEWDLIYHEGKDGNWHKPSQCLWSSATDIEGMVTLNDIYNEDLSNFFTDFLEVPTLTFEMLYEKLMEQGRGDSPVTDIKNTIWLLNSFLQEAKEFPDPGKLIESNVFPIKYADGTVKLCSTAVDFTIPDRKHLADYFSGMIKFLDFETNNIPHLEPFLRWTGLESRYLSTSIKEISALCGDSHRTLISPDRNISRKAHGLLRLAVHCKSPRVKKDEQAFYQLLKAIDVCETDGICSELHFNQDGKDIKVEIQRSELHFQEIENHLTIYVPRKKQDQELCFLDRIPKALLEWIMTDPATMITEPFVDKALTAMSTLLQAQPRNVALVLDRAGIMSVELADDFADDASDISSDQNNNARTPRSSSDGNSAVGTMNSTLFERAVISHDNERVTNDYSSSPQPFVRATDSSVSAPQRVQSPHLSFPAAPEPVYPTEDLEYIRLLNKVVDLARHTELPNSGPLDRATLRQSQDTLVREGNAEGYRLRTSEKIERDKKVGAAGELFIFEILSALDPALPGFSRDNWQSTIRKYVRVHEDYADMEAWSGRETADITFDDTESVLTSLLIDRGYLAEEIWDGAQPRYYLEVKATTLSWDTPFYMSGSQYERMRRISQSGSGDQDSVYVIFRVFNVGQDDMGIKIYVDPNFMREQRELSFTADTWSIVPGPRLGRPEA